MSKVAIIAEHWNDKNIRDGVMQRIQAIDELIVSEERIYIFASYRAIFNISCLKKGTNVQVISLNPLIHYLYLLKLIRQTERVYVHSLHNYVRILPITPFIRIPIILDLHGTLPEECKLAEKHLKAWMYNIVEGCAFKKIRTAVFVTNKMKSYYLKKYSSFKKWRSFVYFIGPKDILIQKTDAEKTPQIESLKLVQDKIVLIYSGNIQVWQNIDLMIEIIGKLDPKKFVVLILTMELSAFSAKFEKNFDNDFIKLLSVRPDELSYYYSVAQYGFILRDDIIVNNVANPTKLVEYLFYGIIPIVKSPFIGDFYDYGYEFIHYDELHSVSKSKMKSAKNKRIAQKMLDDNASIDFKGEVLELAF